MKAFSFVLILGLTWRVNPVRAFSAKHLFCIAKHGFIDSLDSEHLDAILDPENIKLNNLSQDDKAALYACIYKREYGNKSLSVNIKRFIDIDEKIAENEKKKMLETLHTCNTNAAGNNTKLLSCLNVHQAPFDQFAAVIRDIPEALDSCYSKCNMNFGEFYIIYEFKTKASRSLDGLSENKLICALACHNDQNVKQDPISNRSIQEFVRQVVRSNHKFSESEKKESLELIAKCDTEGNSDLFFAIGEESGVSIARTMLGLEWKPKACPYDTKAQEYYCN